MVRLGLGRCSGDGGSRARGFAARLPARSAEGALAVPYLQRRARWLAPSRL